MLLVRKRWFLDLSLGIALFAPSIRAASHGTTPQQPATPQTDAKHQLIPRSQEERERRNQAAHRIVLNVHVTARDGKPSAGLLQPSFTLLADGKPIPVQEFQSVGTDEDGSPAQVILVLDTVNNSRGKLSHFRREIEKYLNEASDKQLAHPVSIALVSPSGATVTPPSRDRDVLRAELKALESSLQSMACSDAVEKGTGYLPDSGNGMPTRDPNPQLDCVNRQFNASVKALDSLSEQRATSTARTILIWIGQGWPTLSDKGFKPDTPSIRQSFFRDLVNLSTAMTEAQITLDAIASPDAQRMNEHDRKFYDGVPTEEQVTAGSLGLHALAHQSGGQILQETKDIAGEIRACVADAASYYVMSFDAPPAATFGEFHSLQVKVNDPALVVRTNTLYYAEQ